MEIPQTYMYDIAFPTEDMDKGLTKFEYTVIHTEVDVSKFTKEQAEALMELNVPEFKFTNEDTGEHNLIEIIQFWSAFKAKVQVMWQ